MINVEMLSTGDEVLHGQIVDTNAAWLADFFFNQGLPLTRRNTVGDDLDALVAILRERSEQADVLIVNGGLGPTSDDLSALAAATAKGEGLILHPEWLETMTRFFAEHGFTTLEILHNNCHFYGETALCGTRGWFYEEDQNGHNEKVFNRELIRLEASLKAAGERRKLCFLHYPPCYEGYRCPEIIALMERYGVEDCYYGHLHGPSHRLAREGRFGTVDYHLVAADYIGFRPKKIRD